MNVRLKEAPTGRIEVTNELLAAMATEFQNEIRPYFPQLRFKQFFDCPEYYRERRRHLLSGGALQSQGGVWRCV